MVKSPPFLPVSIDIDFDTKHNQYVLHILVADDVQVFEDAEIWGNDPTAVYYRGLARWLAVRARVQAALTGTDASRALKPKKTK